MPALRGFARFLARDSAIADDLVQDTIVRALDKADGFTPGTNLRAWCFAILRNLFLEQHRRGRRERIALEDYGHQPASTAESSPHTQTEMQELESLLWQISPLLREALVLVGAQELTYAEAAEICEVEVGTMKARVSRARAALKKVMAAQDKQNGPEGS
ncbi:sigma-70 family RNA polymerase sigma factor [Acetobacter pasteurianus]|uniref:sigma-70 family RNA polymerase sigma factor n=1 Tax=Acetobacter pasteurianus TaxID=438 RepID=UPI00286A8E63|nr:sigma-70 family RNA polymerase sigma factor [Acetobacter pasteurianus]WKC16696.1 sigma-70 family RNA polymerase sigma factor [Acetobacter pasteurianus]